MISIILLTLLSTILLVAFIDPVLNYSKEKSILTLHYTWGGVRKCFVYEF